MSSAQNTVGAMFAYMTRSTAATDVSSTQSLKTEKEAKGFDSIFNMVSTTSSRNIKTDNNQNDRLSSAEAKDAKGKALDSSADSTKLSKTKNSVEIKETKGKEADKELQNTIEEDGKTLMKQIADELEVSEDEITAAMQLMGLTIADLLNPENMIQLFNSLNTDGDGINILVDPELSESLQGLLDSVNEIRTDLMEEYNLLPQDLNAEIETFNQSLPETEFKTPDNTPVNDQAVIDVNAKYQIVNDQKPLDNDNNRTIITEDKINNPNPEISFRTIEEAQQGGSDNNKGFMEHNSESANPFNQLMNNLMNATAEIENPEMVSYTDRAQMEDIVRQIVDKITVSAGETESSMELQLHPASLGNVNILLTSSKDGIVAKFTAQNEIVKEAVESQMIQLQQKFDEQGIKVTSIEVTIASHAFEQNLQQDNNNQPGQEETGRGNRSLRRINLAEMDEDSEEMSEAEMIAAQMMAYNGNSIDFSA